MDGISHTLTSHLVLDRNGLHIIADLFYKVICVNVFPRFNLLSTNKIIKSAMLTEYIHFYYI